METENRFLYELGKGQWNIPKLLDLLKATLTKKTGFENFEVEKTFPDIGKKNMRLDASQIYHQVDSTQTVLLEIEDVTQQRGVENNRKRLSEVLQKRNLELEQANEANQKLLKLKAEFTAAVSHELRTPLTAIKESINIVYQGASGAMEEQKMFLEIAKRNVERLGRLVDNVLDFTKRESGRKALTLSQGNINDLIREGGAFYGVLAARKGLKIRYELQADMPDMKFDYEGMLQVLTNILSNAVKFTQRGEIMIRSELLKGVVEISVQDSGSGIAKEDLKRLFEPFEKLINEDGTKMPDVGLGLSLSKQIIEHHQGKISLQSVIGKGTLVRFSLPLERQEVKEKEAVLVQS